MLWESCASYGTLNWFLDFHQSLIVFNHHRQDIIDESRPHVTTVFKLEIVVSYYKHKTRFNEIATAAKH